LRNSVGDDRGPGGVGGCLKKKKVGAQRIVHRFVHTRP